MNGEKPPDSVFFRLPVTGNLLNIFCRNGSPCLKHAISATHSDFFQPVPSQFAENLIPQQKEHLKPVWQQFR
jgi:hypothetical protein